MNHVVLLQSQIIYSNHLCPLSLTPVMKNLLCFANKMQIQKCKSPGVKKEPKLVHSTDTRAKQLQKKKENAKSSYPEKDSKQGTK